MNLEPSPMARRSGCDLDVNPGRPHRDLGSRKAGQHSFDFLCDGGALGFEFDDLCGNPVGALGHAGGGSDHGLFAQHAEDALDEDF